MVFPTIDTMYNVLVARENKGGLTYFLRGQKIIYDKCEGLVLGCDVAGEIRGTDS